MQCLRLQYQAGGTIGELLYPVGADRRCWEDALHLVYQGCAVLIEPLGAANRSVSPALDP